MLTASQMITLHLALVGDPTMAEAVANADDIAIAAWCNAVESDPLRLILRYNAVRLDYLTRLPPWPTFGKGWARRIARNLKTATIKPLE